MADGMFGADPQQLAAISDTFSKRAQRLAQLNGEVTRRASNPAIWSGPDAEAFRGRWAKTTALADRLGAQLVDLQKLLSTHAAEQRTASQK